MRAHPRIAVIVAISVASTLGCRSDASRSLPGFEASDSAGIRIVESRAPQWSAGDAWIVEADPDLRIGDGDTEAEQFFGIRRVRLLQSGGIVALDGGSSEIRVFDESGRLARAFGGDGDGPGELRGPVDVFVSTGDTVLVWDSRPSATWYDEVGEVVERRMVDVVSIRARMPDRTTIGYRGLPDGSALAVGYLRWEDPSGLVRNRMLYTRAAIDGTSLDTLAPSLDREWWFPSSGVGAGRTLLGPQSHWGSGGDRLRVLVGESAASEVNVFDADGRRQILRFPEADRAVRPEMVQAARSDRRRVPMPSANLERFLSDAPDPERLPAFGGLAVDPDGNVWVLPYFPDEGRDGFTTSFPAQLFSPGGQLLGRVSLPRGLSVHDIGRDRVVGVTRTEYDVEVGQVHRLRRGSGTR